MKDRERLATLLTMILLAGGVALAPGASAAPINNVYAPPTGWQRTTYLARGLGTWANPANDQTITVSATNYSGDINGFTRARLSEISQLPDAKVGAAQQATVCRHHPATYITYEAMRNNKPAIFEEMLAVYTGVAYQATYVRSASEPSQYGARISLTTLCGGIVPEAQTYTHAPQPYRTGAPATPNLGPLQSPQSYSSPAPTVTPMRSTHV